MGELDVSSIPFEYIKTTQELRSACHRLSTHSFITVDTEFLLGTTFYAKLCLIQVGSKDEIIIVDPLEGNLSLDPLKELMTEKSVLKVFYAPHEDFLIFYAMWSTIPSPCFDARTAGIFCEIGSGGYKHIVKKLLGREICKDEQTSDWTKRPLTMAQMEYAANDVRFLLPVYEELSQRLETNGKKSWYLEEMEGLEDLESYKAIATLAWKRFRTPKSKEQLGVLMEVAELNMERAKELDKPLSHILPHELVNEIMKRAPQNVSELSELEHITREHVEWHGTAIIDAVKRGLQRDSNTLPDIFTNLQGSNVDIFNLLKMLLDITSRNFGINKDIIAKQHDLKRLAAAEGRGEESISVMHGWRREVFGNTALALFQGKIALRLKDGRPEMLELPTI